MVVGTVNMPLPRTEILPKTPNPRFWAGGWFPSLPTWSAGKTQDHYCIYLVTVQ